MQVDGLEAVIESKRPSGAARITNDADVMLNGLISYTVIEKRPLSPPPPRFASFFLIPTLQGGTNIRTHAFTRERRNGPDDATVMGNPGRCTQQPRVLPWHLQLMDG